MGVEDLQKRTEERKASGEIPDYSHHRNRSPAPRPAVELTVLRSVPCKYEGAIIEFCTKCGAQEGRHVRDCAHPGNESERCTRQFVSPTVRTCATCDLYTAPDSTAVAAHGHKILVPNPPAVPAPAPFKLNEPAPTAPTVGVVIGSYKWPELIDLQCKVIRRTCGPVPILVSTDRPEDVPALAAIVGRHADVFLWPNVERIGHTGGDISAFYKGVMWGKARGLSVVAKLSQRFFLLRSRWLQDGARDLLASGLPMATRRATGVAAFDVRSEAALLDVNQWFTSDVLARITPRRYWTDSPFGLSAETILFRVLTDLLGGIYFPWTVYTNERFERAADTVWHCCDPVSTYWALAAEYGVTLPPDFSCDGWEGDLRAGKYLYG